MSAYVETTAKVVGEGYYKVTLAELRSLIAATESWPDETEVKITDSGGSMMEGGVCKTHLTATLPKGLI